MITNEIQVENISSPELFHCLCALLGREGTPNGYKWSMEIPSQSDVSIRYWRNDIIKPMITIELKKDTNIILLNMSFKCGLSGMEKDIEPAALHAYEYITEHFSSDYWNNQAKYFLRTYPYAFNNVVCFTNEGTVHTFRITPYFNFILDGYSYYYNCSKEGPNYRVIDDKSVRRSSWREKEDDLDKAKVLNNGQISLCFWHYLHGSDNHLCLPQVTIRELVDLNILPTYGEDGVPLNQILSIGNQESRKFVFFSNKGFILDNEVIKGALRLYEMRNWRTTLAPIIPRELSPYGRVVLEYQCADGRVHYFLLTRQLLIPFTVANDSIKIEYTFTIQDSIGIGVTSSYLGNEVPKSFIDLIKQLAPEPIYDGHSFVPLVIDNTSWDRRGEESMEIVPDILSLLKQNEEREENAVSPKYINILGERVPKEVVITVACVLFFFVSLFLYFLTVV